MSERSGRALIISNQKEELEDVQRFALRNLPPRDWFRVLGVRV
jgi:hypothetical protein